MACARRRETRDRVMLILHLVLSHMIAIGCHAIVPAYLIKGPLRIGITLSIPLATSTAVFILIFYLKYFASLYFLSSEMDLFEAVYLSTNPRKTRTVQYGKENQKIVPSAVQNITTLLEEMIRIIRSALWINVSAISMCSNALPINVRTRLTTIAIAINTRNKCHSTAKGSVVLHIAAAHRIKEENSEVTLPHPYRSQRERYWQYWNDLEYEPRQFIEKNGSRVVVGALGTSKSGEYVNSLGESKGFCIDTGDHVIMTEVPGHESSISIKSSRGADVRIPLSCAQANNLVHWMWQFSTDTVYGILEGRNAATVDRNVWEMDVGLLVFGILLRLFLYWYFDIIDDRKKPGASDPVTVALLHLSILAATYTIRQSYLKEWVRYKGKRVISELCFPSVPHQASGRLARMMRTILATEVDERDRVRAPPVFIGDTNEDLFLHETWGIDCSNSKFWDERDRPAAIETVDTATDELRLPV